MTILDTTNTNTNMPINPNNSIQQQQEEEQSSSSPTDLKRAISSGTFISKLWIMLNDASNNHLIRWSVNGHAICIPDVAAFSKDILPQYFKHNNWSSFIRQLNLYEFRRVNVSEPTGGNDPRQTYFFMNDDFQRGQSDRLTRIKRQSTAHKTNASPTTAAEMVSSQRRRASNEMDQDQQYQHCCVFSNEDGTCVAESKMVQLHRLVVETEKKCNRLSKEAENLRTIYNEQQELLSTLLDSVRTMTTMIHNPTTTETAEISEQTSNMAYSLQQHQQQQSPNSRMVIDSNQVHPLTIQTRSSDPNSLSSRISTPYYAYSNNENMEIDSHHNNNIRHHSFNVSRHADRAASDPTSNHHQRHLQRESLPSLTFSGQLYQQQQKDRSSSMSNDTSFEEARQQQQQQQQQHYHHEQLQYVLGEIMVTGDDSDTLPPLKKN